MTTFVAVDFEPLVALVGRRLGVQPHRHRGCPCRAAGIGACLSGETVARELGVTRRSIERWKAKGTLPRWIADRICDRIGVHPTEVWGSDYYAATAA